MPTTSIRLSNDEADELQQLLSETGESEELVLRRAALRGICDLRIEQGIRAFQDGRGSTAAAMITGVPRAVFVQLLSDRDIVILEGPSSMAAEIETLAERLGDTRLAAVARSLHPPHV